MSKSIRPESVRVGEKYAGHVGKLLESLDAEHQPNEHTVALVKEVLKHLRDSEQYEDRLSRGEPSSKGGLLS